MMGLWLGWPFSRSILLGFVVSLSSTAVVLKLLHDRGELQSKPGQNVILILLTQDLAVVPMLIIISLLGDKAPSQSELFLQIGGGTLLLALSAWLISRDQIKLPFMSHVRKNHELQVFTALLICFGMAYISGVLNLSVALGAFIAGMIVATAKETEWVHHALAPLHVIFVAIFFVSVGMLIDIVFLQEHLLQILFLTIIVLLSNTFINSVILRALNNTSTWSDALYSGALLSQVGEFSFVLAAVGLNSLIITQAAYQMTIAVIAISLLVSPVWVSLIRSMLDRQKLA
jgi:CPA2 family monovalent cation:H+ antiporter-2